MVPFLIEATARLRAGGVQPPTSATLSPATKPNSRCEVQSPLTDFRHKLVSVGSGRLVLSFLPKSLGFHLQAIKETQGVLDLPPHGDAPCPKNEIAEARISAYGKIHIAATVQSENVTSFRMAVV
jgi:hypothetical protein